MSLSKIMKLGEVLELTWKKITVKTKLQDIIDDSSVVVYRPTIRSIPLRILYGQEVKFSFCRDDGRYIFYAVIEETYEKEGVKLSRFRLKSELHKEQLRNFYRLNVGLDALVKFYEPKLDIANLNKVYKVRIKNISEGGLLFSARKYFSVDTLLDISVDLDGYYNFKSSAKVKRSALAKENNNKYKISVQFVDLPTKEQTILSRYILKKQIDNRKSIEG